MIRSRMVDGIAASGRTHISCPTTRYTRSLHILFPPQSDFKTERTDPPEHHAPDVSTVYALRRLCVWAEAMREGAMRSAAMNTRFLNGRQHWLAWHHEVYTAGFREAYKVLP